MATDRSKSEKAVRTRRVPSEDARPESVVERQQTVSGYLLRRAQRRRERFLRRAESFSMWDELWRAFYLAACILFDFLVIPEPIFLFPGAPGWTITAVGFAAALWVEGRFYVNHFALQEAPQTNP